MQSIIEVVQDCDFAIMTKNLFNYFIQVIFKFDLWTLLILTDDNTLSEMSILGQK